MRRLALIALFLAVVVVSHALAAGPPWSPISNTSATSSPATTTLSAPAQALASGQATRVRCFSASIGGTAAGNDLFKILDGSTIIFAQEMAIPANGYASVTVCDADWRTTPGNNLTCAFATGVGSAVETVNCSGDFVQQGAPFGQ